MCDTVLDLMAHASSSSSLPAGLHHEHAAAGDQQAGQRASGDAQDRLQARQEDWLQAPTLRRRRTGSVGCVSHDGMLGLSSASHARRSFLPFVSVCARAMGKVCGSARMHYGVAVAGFEYF